MTLVLDASAATTLCLAEQGFELVGDELHAPVLSHSEVLASLRGLEWRGEITPRLADIGLIRLREAPIRLSRRAEILPAAVRLARQLDWAKTYDAEYVTLALWLHCPLVTIDDRLARRVGDLVQVHRPS